MDGVTAQAESFLQGLESQAQQEATVAATEVPGLGSVQDAGPSLPLDPAAAAMQLAAQQAAERFNQQFQAQQAQQSSEPALGTDGGAPPSANGSADYAQQPVQAFDQNGVQAAADVVAAPPVAAAADSAAAGRKRRNRWGPKEGEAPTPGQEPAADAAEGGTTPPPSEEPGKKKRRSRWEEPAPEPSMALATVGGGAFPKELVLPGGIKVTSCIHLMT